MALLAAWGRRTWRDASEGPVPHARGRSFARVSAQAWIDATRGGLSCPRHGPRTVGLTVNRVLPGPTSSEGVAELAASQRVDIATVEREFFKSARPSSVIQRFLVAGRGGCARGLTCGRAAERAGLVRPEA